LVVEAGARGGVMRADLVVDAGLAAAS
jgi:hypothetical protein